MKMQTETESKQGSKAKQRRVAGKSSAAVRRARIVYLVVTILLSALAVTAAICIFALVPSLWWAGVVLLVVCAAALALLFPAYSSMRVWEEAEKELVLDDAPAFGGNPPIPGGEVVRVEGLYKRYSKKADWAVTNVNFSCHEGEIVGLLGHNGAGKSTTLKCLEGMLPFEKGKITIAGYDIQKDGEAAKQCMGFVTDNHATFVKMTGLQYINFMADVYEVPTELREKRLAVLEEVFQLGKPIENLISSYSHGMRQKICMMGSLIHQPKLWILDEPMTGLDPRTANAVQEFMHQYVAAGNSIIFSSHALNTVAKLCDRVVLIRKGEQVDELNVKEIYAADPKFDFEEYFLRNERQE